MSPPQSPRDIRAKKTSSDMRPEALKGATDVLVKVTEKDPDAAK